MKWTPTEIPEVVLITPDIYEDPRGFFLETWNRRRFAEQGLEADFVQDNHSRSKRGVLRGLHYQVRQPQGKLVSVMNGEVFDVAVDLRRSSATFGSWVGAVLDSQENAMLWIPPGFAHGFYVLSETADLAYKCTDYYAPEHDRTLAWDDPDIHIDWPLVGGHAPLLSARDAAGAPFKRAETFP